MKTKIIAILYLAFSILNGYAQDVKSSSKIDSASEIGAQSNITKAAIDQLLRRLDDKALESNYDISDYRAQYPLFKKKIETGLDQFRVNLYEVILKKLSFWIDRYNQTFDSKEYSKEQKDALLKQQYEFLINQAHMIEKDYHSEIEKLHELVLRKIITPAPGEKDHIVQWSGQVYKRLSKENKLRLKKMRQSGCEVYKKRRTSVSFYNFDKNHNYFRRKFVSSQAYLEYPILSSDGEIIDYLIQCNNYYDGTLNWLVQSNSDAFFNVFLKYAYPDISEGCSSAVCMGLKQNDMLITLTLINQSFDRNIVLRLSDGKQLQVNKKGLDTRLMSALLSSTRYPDTIQFESKAEVKK